MTQEEAKVMKEFEKPVKMADGSLARLDIVFSKGDFDCDKCSFTIYAINVRWIVRSQGVEKCYHYQCYQPIVSAS